MAWFWLRRASRLIRCDSASSSVSALPSPRRSRSSCQALAEAPAGRSPLGAFSLSLPTAGGPSRRTPSACKRTSSSQTCTRVCSWRLRPPSRSPAPAALCEAGLKSSNWTFIDLRRSARLACSGERSLERSSRGSLISSSAACNASSRACSGVLEKSTSKSQPPSWPLMRPTSAWRPERTFSAMLPRRSNTDGSSWLRGAMGESAPAPCSKTNMQWRPPRLPLTHCRRACFDASDSELHSSSPAPLPSAAAPPPLRAGVVEARSRLGRCASRGRRPGCCTTCSCGSGSGRNHFSSTCARPLGWTDPRPEGFAGSSLSAGCV
mmetsp:Transcript_118213/g.381548  ORF Transcript_118213/g.381548 Transcript_118213/m.381548 type:complete len:321 (+) Transcript_118213:50-1012(+)